jgi:hypothetical protein
VLRSRNRQELGQHAVGSHERLKGAFKGAWARGGNYLSFQIAL